MASLRVKATLFSAYFLFAILLNTVGVVILQAIEGFGVSKEEASVLEAFKDLPIAAVSFLVASFLAWLGYKRALMAAFALVAIACAAMPLAPAFATAKLLFFAVGVSFALVKVSVYALIGLVTDSAKEHASLLNFLEGFFMIGVLAGYWLFAAFIDPAQPGSPAWLNVYWPLSALAAANIALVAFTAFPAPPKAPERRTIAGEFGAMARLAWRPAVLSFVVAAFLYVLIEQGVGTWLPTFNKEVLHLPAAMSVQATSLFAAALAAGRLGAGVLLARVEWSAVLIACILAMGALILLTVPATRGLEPQSAISWSTAPFAAFMLPMIGLFLAPIYPAINSVVLNSLPKERHAPMAGLIVVFSALGGTTGSFITGRVFAAFDGQTAFLLSLAPMGGLLAAIVLLKRLTAPAEPRSAPQAPARS